MFQSISEEVGLDQRIFGKAGEKKKSLVTVKVGGHCCTYCCKVCVRVCVFICRYIGEGYSKAQEKLEDEMREFYRQDNTKMVLTSPLPGQLTAARAEEEEEITRAQVCEVIADKVKVRYCRYCVIKITNEYCSIV